MKDKLTILVEQDEMDYFIVSCPNFKGCHSYGSTIEEALKNIDEIIDMYLEDEIPVFSFELNNDNLN